MTKKRKWFKTVIRALTGIVLFMNVIAIFHAYKFTHFTDSKIEKTKDPGKLTPVQKLKTLLTGISNPRPENKSKPATTYQTLRLKSNREIECWSIQADTPKGTVILFHGFSGEKSGMLDKADIFGKLGYNTILVDLMGSGGSEGNLTTVGFLEAAQVKTCFDYLKENGENNIYLFGTSMGSVAIMKAINDYGIHPKAIIIECPFGTMYQTVCARFKTMNAPIFPMAALLVLWGGLQNGFWAFAHNPTEYAKKIDCPALLLYGAKDERVSRGEIDEVFGNLGGEKKLKVYQNARHENYLRKYQIEWTRDVEEFLLLASAKK